MSSKKRLILPFLLAGLLCGAASALHADDNDPPSRVARLAYLQGGVSLRPAGADDWVEAGLNRPLTIGDQLWSDRGGRIEMQLDGSNLRLGSETSAGILNLSDDATQIQLSSGTLIVHVRDLADNESYEIDTPNVAFSILRPGTYRLDVDENGGSTAIAVRSGQGEAVGGNGTGYTLRAGEYDTFAGVEQIAANTGTLGPQDEFDAWSAERDGRFDHSQSAQYVANDVVGYEELDNQGDWDDTPDYGHVWFPSGVQAGWAPYQQGHWAYVAPWGYTWIDDRPWGFAPFHYGRWVYWRQRWGWVPAPPPAPRAVYVRPVYAPALVAWVGSGATVAWFPLAPREVYVPSYPVSRRYLNVINVSNTQVNTTIINNVYNTTIVNRTTINNVTYANRRVPGAIMASSTQDFASARPMRRDGGVGARAFADAPVRAFAPPVVPTRAAVYGGRGPTERQPSQAVQTRVTAARMAPAATPSSLDARLQSPRSAGANRVQPPVAAATPRVRVVPPVRTLVSSRDIDNSRLQTAPAAAPSAGSTRPPAHAAEIPTAPRAPSPAGANSVLERQQSQEQQQLQSRQDLERARVQQQQDQQHKRLADGQALDAQRQVQSQAVAELARRQQLDQQRQDQQHNAQLGQLQAQQREQQQAQAQAEQHRAAQQDRQRELDQQVQRQRNAQLQAQQAQQAQAQAEVQKNQALERQRESAQLQSQRQQQALDAQVQTRERQMEQQHLQQTQQLQQQQNRAREELQERQQAAQRQQEQQRRPNPPQPQNPRQPR